MELESLKNLIQDWVNTNPIFKKKFTIDSVYRVSDNTIELTTSPTTKINLTNLKKYLKPLLFVNSMDDQIINIVNLVDEFNYEEILILYFQKCGLQETEYDLKINKVGQKYYNIEVSLDIDVERWVTLNQFYVNKNQLITYNIIPSKYSYNFEYSVNYGKLLTESAIKLNEKFQIQVKSCLMQKSTNNENFWNQENPTLGFKDNMPQHIEIFVNSRNHVNFMWSRERKECFYNFFHKLKKFDANMDEYSYMGWSFYVRGEWVKPGDVILGVYE